ncbi:NAD-dependent succinate-semialdehyde dehydrogenase [Aliiglaciecola aliphaticivorans]
MLNLNDPTLLKTASYIDGRWLITDNQIPVINPANGQELVSICDADVEDANRAVEAAHRALPQWSALSAQQRANLLRNLFQLMMQHQDDLAQILTLEQGKTFAEAKGEIAYGASFIEWFAEEGKRIYGDVIPAPSSDKQIIVLKQPIGVVSAITPWNFPNAMISRKAAAALAAGCTFVVRPATQTPLSAMAMAELTHRAGFPPGVFNLIVGKDSQGLGSVLTQHPHVAKFTFTGSTGVGKKLIAQCATSVKRVSMELGGNAPFIVFDDADIDEAVQGALASKYRNSGQTCVCTNRILVQKGVYAQFCEKFIEETAKLKLGAGMDADAHIGPMINAKAANDVDELVQQSIDQGAVLKLGGTTTSQGPNYYLPTVLTNVSNDMPIASNEIFGPVSPIIQFEEESEVIELANATEYGLAAYFYSRDVGRIFRVAKALEFGMVGINEGAISNAAAPFGGMKQSGNGREGSRYGLDDYLEIKYLCLGGLNNT